MRIINQSEKMKFIVEKYPVLMYIIDMKLRKIKDLPEY